MSLHHPRLYHKSEPNTSPTNSRILFSIRYMPSRAAPHQLPDFATLISGRYVTPITITDYVYYVLRF